MSHAIATMGYAPGGTVFMLPTLGFVSSGLITHTSPGVESRLSNRRTQYSIANERQHLAVASSRIQYISRGTD